MESIKESFFNSNKSSEEPGSILGAFINQIPVNTDFKYNILIGIEAALAVLISVFFALASGIVEAGLASLALASAAIVPRVNQILRYNRERIWDHDMNGWKANRKSIVSGGVILIAMVAVYSTIASLTDPTVLAERFTFIGVTYSDALLTPERFANGMLFFAKNSRVLFLFFLLSFVFRGLGTSLALGWNAGVWSVTIVLMIRTGLADSQEPIMYSLMAFVSIAPHLIIEGLAYITASLAGIFFSRAITLYGFSDPKLKKVMIAVVALLLASVAILGFGAIIEHYWAPLILELL